MNTRTLRILTLAALALGLSLGGCGYKPGGNSISQDEFTYISEPFLPITLQLIDTRTGEVFWEYEIPVGKQLTFRFFPNKEPKNAYTPDLMRWELFDKPTGHGGLRNTMLVPPSTARRVDYFTRETPEFAPADNG